MDRIQKNYINLYLSVYANGSHTANTEAKWDALCDASDAAAWDAVQSQLNAAETYVASEEMHITLVNAAVEQLYVHFRPGLGSFPKP